MKKLILIFGAGALGLLALLVFGVGYLLYALLPVGSEFLTSARDGVFVIEENGRRVERRLSRECVARIEEMTTMANLWQVFRAEDWKTMLPESCWRDFEGTSEPAPPTDLEWESQDSETI